MDILAIRTEFEFTRPRFAYLIRLSDQTVKKWEKGKSAPNKIQTIRIEALVKVLRRNPEKIALPNEELIKEIDIEISGKSLEGKEAIYQERLRIREELKQQERLAFRIKQYEEVIENGRHNPMQRLQTESYINLLAILRTEGVAGMERIDKQHAEYQAKLDQQVIELEAEAKRAEEPD